MPRIAQGMPNCPGLPEGLRNSFRSSLGGCAVAHGQRMGPAHLFDTRWLIGLIYVFARININPGKNDAILMAGFVRSDTDTTPLGIMMMAWRKPLGVRMKMKMGGTADPWVAWFSRFGRIAQVARRRKLNSPAWLGDDHLGPVLVELRPQVLVLQRHLKWKISKLSKMPVWFKINSKSKFINFHPTTIINITPN